MIRKQTIDDTTCATVDTGCQRLAIGSSTLKKYAMKLPPTLQVTLHSKINRFKSVHNVSTTSKVATVPSSLGPKGTFLRPAVFEDSAGHQAPFLISLTFLMHCNSTLGLDEESGLYLMFRDNQNRIPLHLGPSNALRVPLQLFEPNKIEKLRQVQGLLHQGREFEVLALTQNFWSRTVGSTPSIAISEECHGVDAHACPIYHIGSGEAGRVGPPGEKADGTGDSKQPSDGATSADQQPQEDDGHFGGEDGDGGLDPRPGVDRGADSEASSLPRSTRLRGGLCHHDGLGRRRSDRAYIGPTSTTSRTPMTPATTTSRTLTTRRHMPTASSSLAPSEALMQDSTGTNGAGKVGDVKGLEIVFGYIPPCHCGHQARLHLSRTEKNFEKFFLRCPRDPGVQCNYFQWTTAQPFQDVTAWKYKDQGAGAVPAAEALQDSVQNTCQHKNTTKQGSNGEVERVTCKSCGKLLSVKPRKEIKDKKASSSTGTNAEFEEYQKFLGWKSPCLTNRSEKFERP